ERAEVLREQRERSPGQVRGHHRRLLEAGEMGLRLLRLAGLGGDVRAGEERGKARDLSAGDARAHHPEARILHQEVARVRIHLRDDDHALVVRRELHAAYGAYVDVAVLDPGLARLDAL